MVEVLLLMAFKNGASRLEYRTIDDEFRVAEIIDERAYEYPQPPDSIRQPTIEYLMTICGVTEADASSECSLRVGHSTALVRCDFAGDRDAIITLLRPFEPPIDLYPTVRRFWKACAAKRGLRGLARFYWQDLVWWIQDLAKGAMRRSAHKEAKSQAKAAQ
ncbi:MAG: hypothetical protein ACTHK7_02895 [Aureliella sp.]